MSALLDSLQQAMAHLQRGQAEEATRALEAICKMPPASPLDCYAHGVALHCLGRLEAALAAFERALAALPNDVDTLNARGAVLQGLGRTAEAQASYEKAHTLDPGNAQIVANLAIVLEAQAKFAEALRRYEDALAVDASNRTALMNMSALLLQLERPADALGCARRAVTAYPALADAGVTLAQALLALDRYDEAKDAAERALALAPTAVGAQIVRAVALACLGWFAASAAAFRLARAVDPTSFDTLMRNVWAQSDPARANWPHGPQALPDPRVIYLARGAVRLARCDWTDRDAFLERMHRIVREGVEQGIPVCGWILPFATNWLPLDDDVRFAVATAVGEAIERHCAPARMPNKPIPRQRPRRLKLGYLTPDVRDHPNVSLTAPMLACHDRDRFEVYAYALNARCDDPMAMQFRDGCDLLRECHGQDDTTVARRIRSDGVDILVDLAGYTDMARPEIPALRPAPLNCTYLGHPGTSGGKWVDYRISDPVSTPASTQAWWSERLALLSRTMFAYAPIELPPQVPTRASEGLPEQGIVFCCFHTANKIDPAVFHAWLRLLRAVPTSVLWLAGNERAAPQLIREAVAQAIDPQRLVFARRLSRKADHLNRQRLADLFLDTPAYNAHTTAVEALLAGLPVLTCPAPGPASRVATSILSAAGLERLIATDLADYEARARALASSPATLDALRTDWESRREQCALFDPKGLAREIERCYDHIWTRHVQGLPPVGFQLEPLHG